jgi:quercetin dioxygenase-like cupin family protein
MVAPALPACGPLRQASGNGRSERENETGDGIIRCRPWDNPTLGRAPIFGRLPRRHEEVDMRRVLFVAAVLAFGVSVRPATAQDPLKVDAKHYKVEFENDQVRVLRINYGPHEKSVMHEHPPSVAVFLTDGQVRFTLPGGKTQDAPVKAGTSQWESSGKHLPENIGDKPFELVLVELKTKPATAK